MLIAANMHGLITLVNLINNLLYTYTYSRYTVYMCTKSCFIKHPLTWSVYHARCRLKATWKHYDGKNMERTRLKCGKRLLWMPNSDYSRRVISMTLQEHKVSRCVCCYWSVTDDLVLSAASNTLNTHFQGRGSRKHQMLAPTNTTIVLGGWRQSTAVKWRVKTVRSGSQIQFITRSRRQVLCQFSEKARGEFHPYQVSCMPGEGVAVCYIQTVHCSTNRS